MILDIETALAKSVIKHMNIIKKQGECSHQWKHYYDQGMTGYTCQKCNLDAHLKKEATR